MDPHAAEELQSALELLNAITDDAEQQEHADDERQDYQRLVAARYADR
jgi:hypothetical protein